MHFYLLAATNWVYNCSVWHLSEMVAHPSTNQCLIKYYKNKDMPIKKQSKAFLEKNYQKLFITRHKLFFVSAESCGLILSWKRYR